jgi:hypothetical protein
MVHMHFYKGSYLLRSDIYILINLDNFDERDRCCDARARSVTCVNQLYILITKFGFLLTYAKCIVIILYDRTSHCYLP